MLFHNESNLGAMHANSCDRFAIRMLKSPGKSPLNHSHIQTKQFCWLHIRMQQKDVRIDYYYLYF